MDENGEKLFKKVENTVAKGEIVHCMQFLLFPQCFKKTYAADTLKQVLVWDRVKLKTFLLIDSSAWL